MSIGWALNEHWMSIGWALNEHWMSIKWALNEHWMSIGWALNEHWMSIEQPAHFGSYPIAICRHPWAYSCTPCSSHIKAMCSASYHNTHAHTHAHTHNVYTYAHTHTHTHTDAHTNTRDPILSNVMPTVKLVPSLPWYPVGSPLLWVQLGPTSPCPCSSFHQPAHKRAQTHTLVLQTVSLLNFCWCFIL